uniref:Uncharacterized protein n=1 Tax=Trypanosoma congolense (strain IL3000) TaxID=1068625 RepID=G0URP4_TRYCI|nr:hypothetical protein, unlikely [Trypanosoma congolense IL3000]
MRHSETQDTGAVALLAQSVERTALNRVVVGSSPTGGAFLTGQMGLTVSGPAEERSPVGHSAAACAVHLSGMVRVRCSEAKQRRFPHAVPRAFSFGAAHWRRSSRAGFWVHTVGTITPQG